jgi:hypothetical protein
MMSNEVIKLGVAIEGEDVHSTVNPCNKEALTLQKQV